MRIEIHHQVHKITKVIYKVTNCASGKVPLRLQTPHAALLGSDEYDARGGC